MFRFCVLAFCLVAVAVGQQAFPQQSYPQHTGYPQQGAFPQQPYANLQQTFMPFPVQQDRYYCSAQASFPVIEPVASNVGGYGGAGNFQQSQYQRKSCRFAAATSFESCNSCCKKASTIGKIQDTEVFGTVFFFNPENPPFDTTSVSNGAYGGQPQTVPAEPVVIDAATGRAQCFCCTKRR